jgi:GH18 family chitinase
MALPAWAARPRVVAYVPNWVELTTFAGTIDYPKLTHINIAFENPTNDAGDLSFNKKNPILVDKAHAAGVKVLISIGGGSASTDKPLMARYFKLIDAQHRAAFVARLADYVAGHNFDGVDVDIEGPSINKDYGAFVTDLAKALKAENKLLTAALSKGYGG